MNLSTSASKKTKKDTCIFKYSYDGKRISMEKFLEFVEMNDANNAFIEWEYNVMNYLNVRSKGKDNAQPVQTPVAF